MRNEYVHIGVILREAAAEDQPAQAEVRFTRDWRRVRCLDPDADTALLEGMESELRRRLQQEPGGRLMRIARGVALAERADDRAQGLSGGEPARGHGRADAALCGAASRGSASPRLSGRAAIQARMRTEFEHAGVWDLLRKRIAASEYTRPGDPLRIDVGYRPNGVVRMFHAVSLDPGLETAKVLAFSAAALRRE